jgi:hypothetical protein
MTIEVKQIVINVNVPDQMHGSHRDQQKLLQTTEALRKDLLLECRRMIREMSSDRGAR